MATYKVLEPFKDGIGQHRSGDVLDDIDHAEMLVNAGLIVAEPEETISVEPQKESIESEEAEDDKSATASEQPEPQKAEEPATTEQPATPKTSKKTGGKKKKEG